FFVFFGLSTDPGALPPVLLPALGLALVGMITKLITGWFAARRAGVGTPGRIRAGTTLMARGEFSIVLAGLAAAPGLNDDLASLTAAYVLILAVAGPLAARVSDPLAKYVRLWRVRREGASETASPAAPAVRREEAEVVSEEASSASTTP